MNGFCVSSKSTLNALAALLQLLRHLLVGEDSSDLNFLRRASDFVNSVERLSLVARRQGQVKRAYLQLPPLLTADRKHYEFK